MFLFFFPLFWLYSFAFFDISNIDLLVFLFHSWSDNNNNANDDESCWRLNPLNHARPKTACGPKPNLATADVSQQVRFLPSFFCTGRRRGCASLH
jgi:hypothetical protein